MHGDEQIILDITESGIHPTDMFLADQDNSFIYIEKENVIMDC